MPTKNTPCAPVSDARRAQLAEELAIERAALVQKRLARLDSGSGVTWSRADSKALLKAYGACTVCKGSGQYTPADAPKGTPKKVCLTCHAIGFAGGWDNQFFKDFKLAREEKAKTRKPEELDLSSPYADICHLLDDLVGEAKCEQFNGRSHHRSSEEIKMDIRQRLADIQELAQQPVSLDHVKLEQPPASAGGLTWMTVAEHGLPKVNETVLAGFWYEDTWLKPEFARKFMVGVCTIHKETDKRNYPLGKRWQTFGPAHSQITHWARFNNPSDDGSGRAPASADGSDE